MANPYQVIWEEAWTKLPAIFKINPRHLIPPEYIDFRYRGRIVRWSNACQSQSIPSSPAFEEHAPPCRGVGLRPI